MTYWTCRGERAFIMLVVRKKQLFGAICTWFEFSIGYMMSMLNFSLLEQTLDLLLLKHYCEILYMCQRTDQMGTSEIFAYNFLHNYATTLYSTCLESYDPGLSNKPKFIT